MFGMDRENFGGVTKEVSNSLREYIDQYKLLPLYGEQPSKEAEQ